MMMAADSNLHTYGRRRCESVLARMGPTKKTNREGPCFQPPQPVRAGGSDRPEPAPFQPHVGGYVAPVPWNASASRMVEIVSRYV